MRATIFATLVLCACVPAEDGSKKHLLPTETCGADRLQHLIDLPYEARDFEIERKPVRVLPPGSIMTMDHRPDRLNVDLDQDGMITRIWCG